MQPQETCRIDLASFDPAMIKLMLDFMYEDEYEPRLPKKRNGRIVVPKAKQTNAFAHYKFPHSCEQSCALYKRGPLYDAQCQVCSHHECDRLTCDFSCKNFLCGECTNLRVTDLLLHAYMFVLAVEYDIERLKVVASEKLACACDFFSKHEGFPFAIEHAITSKPNDAGKLIDALSKTIAANPRCWTLLASVRL